MHLSATLHRGVRYISRAIGAALLLTALAGTGCRDRTPQTHDLTWTTMGTFATLSLRGGTTNEASEAAALTRDMFDAINRQLSTYVPTSEISQLNQAGTNRVNIGQHTRAMLAASREAARISGGRFDPTLMPLIQLWGFSGGDQPVDTPSPAAIQEARTRVGIQYLEVAETWARFTRPGMRIDLGGIAKGYAVDRTFDELMQISTTPVLINLGGNIRVRGRPAPDRPWRIGIRNPFARAETVGVLALPDGMATATSGNYERFVTIGEQRFSHIIDPATGHPVRGMAGVTILSQTATEADALSTILFILGIEAGTKILKAYPGCSAAFIPDQQPLEIYVTPEFSQHFTPHEPYRSCVRITVPEA